MAHDAIRQRLLSGLPVDDRRLEAAGVSTAVPLDLDALLSWLEELIWGRHDVGVRLDVAQAASARHGWPLHVIDKARDDPVVEQPAAFLAALHVALGARSLPFDPATRS